MDEVKKNEVPEEKAQVDETAKTGQQGVEEQAPEEQVPPSYDQEGHKGNHTDSYLRLASTLID